MSKNLPTVTSQIPRDLRNFIDRLRDMINGGGTGRLVSAKELADAGVLTIGTDGGLTAAAVTTDFGTPPAPTNVTATPAIRNVIVEWDDPAYATHAYAEVWGASTNSISAAVLLGQTPGSVYADELGPSATRYYWVRFVNTQFTTGPYNGTNGTVATTGADLAYTMGLLRDTYGGTSEAPFFQLNSPTVINGVTIPAGTYMKTAFIYDGEITNAKIANLAVDAAKIASAAVTTAKIADANITTAKIADANITTAKIATAAITTALIGDAQITTAKIVDANITTAKIADANITSAKIADANITSAKIADANITAAKIADANITSAKIADAAITSAKIGNGEITNAKIANAAITSAKIGDAEVATLNIQTEAVIVPAGATSSSSGASVTMSLTAGNRVLITAFVGASSYNNTSSRTASIRVGTTVLASVTSINAYDGLANAYIPVPISVIYTIPTTGSYTFDCIYNQSNGTTAIQVLGIKR